MRDNRRTRGLDRQQGRSHQDSEPSHDRIPILISNAAPR